MMREKLGGERGHDSLHIYTGLSSLDILEALGTAHGDGRDL